MTVLKLIRNGWPNSISIKVSDKWKAHFYFRKEPSEMNELRSTNSCTVYPKSLRKMMLEKNKLQWYGNRKV